MDELHAIFWYSPSIAQCLAYEMPRLQVFVHGGQFLLGKARVPPWLRCAAPNLSTSVLASIIPHPSTTARTTPQYRQTHKLSVHMPARIRANQSRIHQSTPRRCVSINTSTPMKW